ncbi:uncharacterized protein LOC134255325, partial [Saccostrea cucullata]|uniref:uncharacterized protein LOC134255325 n=1 Tax=Saccostrea cuccullata TaxID=36930 RepID=UPI002ED044E4
MEERAYPVEQSHLPCAPCHHREIMGKPVVNPGSINNGLTASVNKVSYTNILSLNEGQELLLKVHTLNVAPVQHPNVQSSNYDFSKWFSFVISTRGVVNHVFHPKGEEEEVVAIKKNLASVFASKLHEAGEVPGENRDGVFIYHVSEDGNEGEHNATYAVMPVKNGVEFKKRRLNHPVKNAKASYQKTMTYHAYLGTIHSVLIEENFTSPKTPPDFDPFYGMRKVKSVNEFSTEEYPEMSYTSQGRLSFLTRHIDKKEWIKPSDVLLMASIRIGTVKRTNKHLNISECRKHIITNLTCIENQPEQGSPISGFCFRNIVNQLLELPDEEVVKIAEFYFTVLPPSIFKYRKATENMVDAFGTMNTELSERLLAEKVLLSPTPDHDLVSRVLTHVAIKDKAPSELMLKTLEDAVFHQEKFPTEFYINETLGQYPWEYRQRRSLMTFKEMEDYDYQKVILLETLGNARLDESYDYILSHINSTNSPWIKRAGCHALRSYHHDHAAETLLHLALNDEDQAVRYEASLLFMAHPKGKVIAPINAREETKFDNTTSLDDPYNAGVDVIDLTTGPQRTRRSVWDGISFRLEVPEVDWRKELGTSDIGASFGVIMFNSLDVAIAPIQGHLKVRVHDEAYARVHVGMFGYNFDFFVARVAYLIDNSTKALALIGRYDPEDLPSEFAPTINFVHKVSKLFGDIKTHVMGFVNAVEQTIKVLIPHQAKVMYESIRDIIEGFPKIVLNPKAAITSIGKGVFSIYQAFMILLQQKQKIEEACFFLRDDKPYWFDIQTLLNEYKPLADKVFSSLKSAGDRWISEDIEDSQDRVKTFTNGRMTLKDVKQEAVHTLESIQATLMNPFNDLIGLADNFVRQYKNLFGLVHDIKDAYTTLKNGYDTARGIIDALFGPKVHTSFPKNRRLKGYGCGSGLYPSQTDYKHKGLDLLIEERDPIVAPFSGFITVDAEATDTVVIKPEGGSLQGITIFITNIKPESTIETEEGRWFAAGQTIGIATGSNCANHIHLAFQKDGDYIDPTKYLDSIIPEVPQWKQICDDYKLVFMDVTLKAGSLVGLNGKDEQNLDPILSNTELAFPIPDFSDNSFDPDDTKDIKNEPGGFFYKVQSRINIPKAPDLEFVEDDHQCAAIMNTGTLNVKRSIFPIKGIFTTLLKTADKFLKKFKIRRLKFGTILEFLERFGMTKSKDAMARVMRGIKDIIDNTTCRNPYEMTEDQLVNELLERGKDTKGSRAQLIERLVKLDKGCPLMTFTMPKHNVYCTFDSMCLGLECCVNMKFAIFLKVFKVWARFDPCASPRMLFNLGIDSYTYKIEIPTDISYDGFEGELNSGNKLDLLGGVELIIRYKIFKGTNATLATFGVGLCSFNDAENCLVFINLLDNADIQSPKPDKMTHGQIIAELERRRLSTDGSRSDLNERLSLDDLSCAKITLEELQGNLANILYYKIQKDCLRIDVWADINVKLLGYSFSRTLSAFIELDPCSFVVQVGFEKYLWTKVLLNYNWGTNEVAEISSNVKVMYSIGRNVDEGVFILQFGLMICLSSPADCILDKYLFTDLRIPIPVCRDFVFPGNGSFAGLLEKIGGKMTEEAFELVLKKFNLNDVITSGPCPGIPPAPENCPAEFDVRKNLPEQLKEMVTCEQPPNCWGIDCCLQLTFNIPLGDTKITKNIPFWFKLDPCDFSLDIGFGNKMLLKTHILEYEYGKQQILTLGSGNPPPVEITYKIEQIPGNKGFIVDLRILICFDFDVKVACIPTNDGLHLLKNQEIPLCDQRQLIDIRNFSLTDWMREKSLDLNEQLAEGAVMLLLDQLNLTDFFQRPKCDRTRMPYIPSIQGIHNKCAKTILYLPSKIPDPMSCYIPDYCTGIECCADIPVLGLGLHVFALLDLDKLELQIGMENIKETIKLNDYVWGEVKTYSVADDFSLTDWLQEMDIPSVSDLKNNAKTLLLQQLGVEQYLLETPCDASGDLYFPNVHGWKNECPLDWVVLPQITSDKVRCSLSSNCTRIDCCVDFSLLNLKLHIFLHFDRCNYVISGGIEKKTFSYGLLDFNNFWGREVSMNIGNVVFIKFKATQLEVSKKYVLDMGVSVCLEPAVCDLDIPILKEVLIPILNCDLTMDFNIKDFSLMKWMDDHGLSFDGSLSTALATALFKKLGINSFLRSPACERTEPPYSVNKVDISGWSSDCPAKMSLPTIRGTTACYIKNTCTAIKCCVEVGKVSRTFEIELDIDFCNQKLTFGIEKLTETVSLQGFEYGKRKEVVIMGIVKMWYTIWDNEGEGVYVVTVDLAICFEDGGDCLINTNILDQFKLSKQACIWGTSFLSQDFSLKQFMDNAAITAYDQIKGLALDKLKEALGLPTFLNDPPCSLVGSAFVPNISGIKKVCPKDISSLPTLPSNMVCQITESCTGVDCCIGAEPIHHNFHAYLDIDPCNFTIRFGIDKFQFQIYMQEYSFGVEKDVRLVNVVRIKFQIWDLSAENQYLVNLRFSVCFDSNSACLLDIDIFHEKRLPKKVCDFAVEAIPDFSLDKWKESYGVSTEHLLPTVIDQLMEHLGIAGYLKRPQCTINIEASSSERWIDECPKSQLYKKPSLAGLQVLCSISSRCTEIHCCVHVMSVGRNFETYLDLDTCNKTLVIGIEQYSVEDLVGYARYLVNMKVEVCLEKNNPCVFSQDIAKDLYLPKLECNWSLDHSEFSLSEWYKKTSLSIGSVLSATQLSILKEALGITNFLLPKVKQCNRISSAYKAESPDHDGWKIDCPFAIGNLAEIKNSLPLSCHIKSSQDYFKLANLVYILYQIDEVNKTVLKLSMRVKICLEENTCVYDVMLLDKVVIPKPGCSWDLTYTIPDFSLKNWYNDIGASIGSQLSNLNAAKLLEELGIAKYTQEIPCQRAGPAYSPYVNGWKSDCQMDVLTSPITDSVSCLIKDTCTAVSCCMDIDFLQRSFETYVTVDACNYWIFVGIEKLSFNISLDDMLFGTENKFYLNSVIRIDYKIEDMPTERQFRVSMGLKACFEASDDNQCIINIDIFKNTLLPKKICDWTEGFSTANFSLSEWYRDLSLTEGSILSQLNKDRLLDMLGIRSYLNKNPCSFTSTTYSHANNKGWKNECKSGLTSNLPALPSTVKCNIPDYCTGITCCVAENSVLRHRFTVGVKLDDCNHILIFQIEKLNIEIALKDYNF